ncbi:type II toxin-antitoxin system VapC family toxin [Halomicronema sp. CCY15110]|uniref:type II toxin-antitoxin system VapC family toxin n=1 Tax=Halomicronema sp. CCY15110 TaxID=2767773 RepID=UPI001951B9CB|nr:type II toxin-antitoxin system VapC family toxin [Halomicronema sp. CCY15110]
MKLLLDTHIWLWYAFEDTRLSDDLRGVIGQDTTEVWISPISAWEVMLLVEKGKVIVEAEPTEWIRDSLTALKPIDAAVTREIAILSRQIKLPHQDPADRFIAATALHYGLQLATVDQNLVSAEWLPTIS